MLAIRGNLNKKSQERAFIQFSVLAGPTVTVTPFFDLSLSDDEYIDFFYGKLTITSDARWQFETGIEIEMDYFNPSFYYGYGGVMYHNLTYFSLTDSFLQKVSIPNTLISFLDISRNFLDYLDVNNCVRLTTIRASSNQLESQNIVGLNSVGNRWEVWDGSGGTVIRKILEVLDLSNNKLTQIPYISVGERSVLNEYDISNNFLTGDLLIPANIACPEILNISFNDFLSVDFGGTHNNYRMNRPYEYNCAFNPRLATIDKNIQNGDWESITSLKCNNCGILTLDFPNEAVWNLQYLDVSYNKLTILEISYLKGLRYLYANNNELVSLTPPLPFETSAYHLKRVRVYKEGFPDDYDYFYLNPYRLTECDISTNKFTENPFTQFFSSNRFWNRANGLRYLNISNNPIEFLGSSYNGSAVKTTTTFSQNTQYKISIGHPGPIRVLPGDVVIFTNRSDLPNEAHIIDPTPFASWESDGDLQTYGYTQNFKIVKGISAIPTDEKSLLNIDASYRYEYGMWPNTYTTYHYSSRDSTSARLLQKLVCNNCPNLKKVFLQGLSGLESVELKNNPQLNEIQTGLFYHRDTQPNEVYGTPYWMGGPPSIKSLVINDCPLLGTVNGSLFSFYGRNLTNWDRLDVSNCRSLSFIGININSACRVGFNFSKNNFTGASGLYFLLLRIGYWLNVATGSPDDSNIIDVSGNPGPYNNSTYLTSKTQATARGWQIKEL